MMNNISRITNERQPKLKFPKRQLGFYLLLQHAPWICKRQASASVVVGLVSDEVRSIPVRAFRVPRGTGPTEFQVQDDPNNA